MSKAKCVRKQWLRYEAANRRGHSDYMERAKRYDRFYRGEHWDEKARVQLEGEGRPVLTINDILPAVNAVLGEQATKRASIRYRTVLNGNPKTADDLSKLAMQILDNNDFPYKESEVFADGLIQDRGFFDVRMDFDRQALGEVTISVLDPMDVIPDPDAHSYDPVDWNEVFVTRWMTLGEVGQRYGEDKAKALRESAATGENFGHDSLRFDKESHFGDDEGTPEELIISGEETRSIQRVRVIERQYYRYALSWHFVDLRTGDLRQVPETWDELRARDFAQRNQLGIAKKMTRKVRWRVTADKVMLADAWSPYATFTVVPYFCFFRRGKPFGMVANLISPQEQFNKASSQELHIVNTTANSGWIVESGALVNMTADELAERGAETGLVIEKAPNRPAPEKILPNPIPSGLDRVSTKAQANIRSISGMIAPAAPGANVSGVPLVNDEKRAVGQIQKPLDNLARTRRMVANKILELVQQFYTEERVIQVTNEWTPGEPAEQVVINQAQADGTILNDLTLGTYSTVVSAIPNQQSFDDMMFAEALELRRVGVNIPDHVVIKHSHLPNRDEIALQVAQMTGFGPKSPQEQQIAQIQQDLQLRAQQAEVAKVEAEVTELESVIKLNMSQAQNMDQKAQLETAKMIMELEKKRSEMDLRRRLAELSSQTQLAKQRMSTDTRLVAEAIKRRGN